MPPFSLFYPALDSPAAYGLRDASVQLAGLEGAFTSATGSSATTFGPGCKGSTAGPVSCVVRFDGTVDGGPSVKGMTFTMELRPRASSWRVSVLYVPDPIDGRNGEQDCSLAELVAAWKGKPQNCFEPEVRDHLFYRGLPFGTKYSGQLTWEVVFIQSRLHDLGYAITVDGHYGTQTEAVVRRYQGRHGIGAVGFVGPATWAALFGLGQS